jgi:threonine synthase
MSIAAPSASTTTSPFVPGFTGLCCAACGTTAPHGPRFVCERCFGPLEATYDHARIAEALSRETIAARPRSLWRLAELLPVDELPADGLAVGFSPLVPAPRLAARLGLDRLWIKDDSRNPSLSFKDRNVAIAAARARQFGFHTLACASTGNLAASVAAAAAVNGMRAVVLVPADLEPAKIAQAEALGARVARVDGPYDVVNRLCLELTDEFEGWAVVNVNLRPYYSEGSKSVAFEIAEQLGWRAPDAVVAPIASGSLYTKLRRGFEELGAVGLIEAAQTRHIGGQPAGCAPVATAFGTGSDTILPVARPDTIVRSLAIGSPADGQRSLALARGSGGSVEAVEDADAIAAIRLLAETEGILTETAGGVTVAALRLAIARGVVGPHHEVVAVITGNGLKTLDAIIDASEEEVIEPSLDAFAAWAAKEGVS